MFFYLFNVVVCEKCMFKESYSAEDVFFYLIRICHYALASVQCRGPAPGHI
jgi:hypothetical protein